MSIQDVTKTVQDLTHLEWSERRSSSGTGGMLLKARNGEGSTLSYYKLSCFDDYRGIYGHECINEIIASRLMDILGIEHLHYRLVHATIQIHGKHYETWLNSSKNFRKTGEQKQAFDQFYSLNKNGSESPWDFTMRMGWHNQIEQMMLVDFLIANRDRHGANMEVLKDKQGTLCLAPLFDNGLSFVFSTFGNLQQAKKFDPLSDVPANNYIGSHSLQYNIENFDIRPQVKPLEEANKERLLFDLDKAANPELLNIIWEMLWKRWQWYENFCNR